MPRPDVPEVLRAAPFTRAQAAAAGLSDTALRSAPWRPVFRGVWAHVDLPDDRGTRLQAARLVIPTYGVLCGLTAAWVYGADVRRADDLDIHVGFPAGRRIRPRPGLRIAQETLRPADVWLVDGVRVTSPVRTAFDCLRLLRGDERVVVADALTHLQVTTLDELRAYFAGQRRMRNLRIAERLLDDVEPLSESPMETRMRLRLVAGGLDRPVAQHDAYDPAGLFLGRLDLAYLAAKVAAEYDGAWHWRQRRDDDRRRARLRAAGWDVHVFSAEDIFQDADAMVRQIDAALRARAGGRRWTATS